MGPPACVSLALFAIFCFLVASGLALPLPSSPVHHIAFGSCNAHTRDQSIWKSITDAQPDLFVWLGDVVYADTVVFPLIWTDTPLDIMRGKFDAQKHSPLYSNLRKNTPIVGVWDDHDYGMNNGGSQYKDRSASQTIFMDFLDEPQDSPRRQRPGIYTSYFLPGAKSDKDVQLILLDVRYHKTNTIGKGDFLGEDQWTWLESVLKDSPAKVHLIGSGIQVTPFQKPVQEAWSLFPESRQRLFDLLSRLRVPGVILLSGDVHYSEVLKVPTECSGTGYPVHEFTSSGLTHTCDGMLGNCKHLLNALFKTPYHYPESFFTKLNWGSIRFDWEKETITLQTHNVTGAIVNEVSINIKDIQPPSDFVPPPPGAISQCDGSPNWFLLIPFESYKYVLYLIPLSIIYTIYFVLRYLILPAFCRLRTRNTDLKSKLGKTE